MHELGWLVGWGPRRADVTCLSDDSEFGSLLPASLHEAIDDDPEADVRDGSVGGRSGDEDRHALGEGSPIATDSRSPPQECNSHVRVGGHGRCA